MRALFARAAHLCKTNRKADALFPRECDHIFQRTSEADSLGECGDATGANLDRPERVGLIV
jgi:hypothetical protein